MTDSTSPFHRGEREVQARLGLEDKMLEPGRRMIRAAMPEQHQEFYAQIPVFFVGAADDEDRVWATALTGEPGFASATDDATLSVRAQPRAGDPLAGCLRDGADIGGLGLEFETRRRNRVNGRVTNIRDTGFDIAVRQSFGNCLKYIQTRTHQPVEWAAGASHAHQGEALGATEATMIAEADTFFIASRFAEEPDAPFSGIDVSHRGGKPGFVVVPHSKQIMFPDYAGNRMFNTLGNIQSDPRCGLLFIDFQNGDTLQLTGRAEILWDRADAERFPGAQRVVRFDIDAAIRIENALPLRWSFDAWSPVFDQPEFGPHPAKPTDPQE